jgi:negative regulator of flagellin synthesis FlgM
MEEPMKITHNKVGQNINLTDSGRAEKAGTKSKASEKDSLLSALNDSQASESSRVNLSERAQDIKRAKEIAMATPDIREDKVQRLQKLIDDGKYKVDASDIADKMVDEEAQWT